MKYLKIYENFNPEYTVGEYIDKTYGTGDLTDIYNIYCRYKDLTSLKGIERLINLEFFDCDNNQIDSLEGIENCQLLESLRCCNNKLKDIKGIEKLIKLTELVCAGNKISSLKGIEHCINMKELYCGKNELENLKGIEKLSDMTQLSCTENNLKNIDEIKNLINLELLYVKYNPLKFPLPKEFIDKFKYDNLYNEENERHFKTYECQKEFLEKFPERINDLVIFGINEKIKEEFPDLVEGSEFGFFNLKQ